MADSPSTQVVVFRVGAQMCAAPAGNVREVLSRLPATRIPGVAPSVVGLVNVRGSLLTLLDGHVLLRQPRRPEDDGAILVLEVESRRCGLDVSDVLDFVELPDIGPAATGATAGIDSRLVRGVGRLGDRSFLVLDVEGLLASMGGEGSGRDLHGG